VPLVDMVTLGVTVAPAEEKVVTQMVHKVQVAVVL
jgi:hypothetical protein